MGGPKKNHFLAKQDEEKQQHLDAGLEIGCQRMVDMIMIALRDERVVGKRPWGQKRLERLFRVAHEYDKYFDIAWTDHKEADYKQEEMDRHLRDGLGDKCLSFYERYPLLKRITYKKPKKHWLR